MQPTPRQTLSHKQFFDLCEWIRKPGTVNGAKHASQLAQAAEKELQFAVSQHSIKNAIEATGVEVQLQTRTGTHHVGADPGNTAKKLYALASFVVQLAKDLNVEVPSNSCQHG